MMASLRQGVAEVDETDYTSDSYVGTGVRPGTQTYRDGVGQGDIFSRAGQAIAGVSRALQDRERKPDVGNYGAVQTAAPRPEFESYYEADATKGTGGYDPRARAIAPAAAPAAPAAAIPSSRDTEQSRQRIDQARGDTSNLPTYRDGYTPPQRAAGQEQTMNRVSYDPAAAAKWRAENNVAEPTGSAGSAALQAVRDFARRQSGITVDPSKQSFGEMLGAIAQRKAGARELAALQNLATTEYNAEANQQLEGVRQQGADRRIGLSGEETRRNKEFEEGLESTKAAIGANKAQQAESEARAGGYNLDAVAKGRLNAARERLAGATDPAEREKIKAEIYDLTGTAPKRPEDIVKDIAAAYKDAAGISASEEGFRQFAAAMLAKAKMANGGMVEGYATGGAIPDQSVSTALPFINDYRRYSMMSQNMGITPVGIEDFAYIRGAAKQAQQAVPGTGMPQQGAQMGMQTGFADGGAVYESATANDPIISAVGAVSNAVSPIYNAVQNTGAAIGRSLYDMTNSDPMASQEPRQQPANMFLNRTRQIDRVSNFADGGAIPVAGQKVVGPGTGRSDSIPAIIDGNRPAALSTGEYVIPAHVVKAKGTEFFDKLIGKTEKSSSGV